MVRKSDLVNSLKGQGNMTPWLREKLLQILAVKTYEENAPLLDGLS